MARYSFGISEPPASRGGGNPSIPSIPLVVQEYLRDGAPKGSRNHTLSKVAMQVRDVGFNEAQAVDMLLGRSLSIGLGEHEVRRTIQSAYSKPARPPAAKPGSLGADGKIIHHPSFTGSGREVAGHYSGTHSGTSGDVRTLDADPSKSLPKASYVLTEDPLPEALENPTERYLKALFRMGEKVQIVRAEIGDDGKEHPCSRGSLQAIMPLEFWLDKLEKKGGDCVKAFYPSSDPHGIYVCINPLKGERRKIEEIADYRFALVEFDGLPRNHQWQLIVQSQIPCAAVVDSGGKSIHAIVRIDASGLEEYRQRVKLLMEHFEEYGVDTQNIDPTRLSRLPGAKRGDTEGIQTLLSERIGYATFAEWEIHVVHDVSLPPRISFKSLLDFDLKADPNVLIGTGWLSRGGSLIIQGPSGVGKSSLILQMAISWALPNRDFFGIKAKQPLRVMMIQAENDQRSLAKPVQGMAKALKLTNAEVVMLEENISIHREASKTGANFIEMATRMIARYRPDIIFCDPLLSYIGGSVSDQELVSTFVRNQLQPVLETTGVIWVWIHHTGKPGDKRAKADWTDRDKAYLGNGTSDLVNWARTMINIEEASLSDGDIFHLSLSKNGNEAGMLNASGEDVKVIDIQHSKEGVCWQYADFGDLEAMYAAKEEMEKKGRKPDVFTKKQMARIHRFLEENAGCSNATLVEEVIKISKCSEGTARKRLKELREAGVIRVVEAGSGMAFECYNAEGTASPDDPKEDDEPEALSDEELAAGDDQPDWSVS